MDRVRPDLVCGVAASFPACVRREAADSTADSEGAGGARAYCSALFGCALEGANRRAEPRRARSHATRAWLQRTPVQRASVLAHSAAATRVERESYPGSAYLGTQAPGTCARWGGARNVGQFIARNKNQGPSCCVRAVFRTETSRAAAAATYLIYRHDKAPLSVI